MSASTKELLEKRRKIARRIDSVLGEHPDVTAIYVLGSVASGRVDKRSDVDLGVVCRSQTLPESDRKELLSPIGSDWQFGSPSSEDPFWAGNAMIAGSSIAAATMWVQWVLPDVSQDFGDDPTIWLVAVGFLVFATGVFGIGNWLRAETPVDEPDKLLTV